jgi:hypothetical protein
VFPKMFKNIIITVLVILLMFVWLTSDLENDYYNLDDVTIEYKCSVIREYKNIPAEVLEECRKRKKVTEDVDNKITT